MAAALFEQAINLLIYKILPRAMLAASLITLCYGWSGFLDTLPSSKNSRCSSESITAL